MGGEKQRSSLTHDTGYSEKAHCTGKPSYLELKGQSLQKIVEDRSRIAGFLSQYMLENAVRTMQEPVEGVCLAQFFRAFIKGMGVSNREQTSLFQQHESTQNCTPHSTATPSNPKDPNYENIASRHSKKVNINPQVMDNE